MTDDDQEQPATPPAAVDDRADLARELDALQAWLRATRDTFTEQIEDMFANLGPGEQPFTDEQMEKFDGVRNMFMDSERNLTPRIEHLQRRLEAMNQEDLTRAALNASQAVARATWVLAGATIVLALATLALIWATVAA